MQATTLLLMGFILLAPGCRSRQHKAAVTRDPKAVAVIKRAVETSGGLTLLREKLRSYTVRAVIKEDEGELTSTAHWKAPDRLVLTFGDMEVRHIGQRCQMTVKGTTKDCPPLPDLRNEAVLFRTHVTDLYPLVEPRVALAYRGAVADRHHPGRLLEQIRVENRRRTVAMTLFFDRQSGLLVETEHATTRRGKRGVSSTRYLDYRRTDGLQLAMRLVGYFDQAKTSVTRIKWLRLGQVDEAVFRFK